MTHEQIQHKINTHTAKAVNEIVRSELDAMVSDIEKAPDLATAIRWVKNQAEHICTITISADKKSDEAIKASIGKDIDDESNRVAVIADRIMSELEGSK